MRGNHNWSNRELIFAMKHPFALLTAFLLVLPVVTHAAAKVGEPAPGFTLTDIEGKEHSLSDFAGKYVVLEWVNLECPFVRKHYDSKNMQALQKDSTDKGVVWLSICSSAEGKQGNFTSDKWKEQVEKEGAAPTAVLLDPDGKVGKAYGATTTPEMFVIDAEGKIVYAGAIDSIRSTDVEDVAKAENYVKNALEATMAGKPVETAQTKSYGCSVKY